MYQTVVLIKLQRKKKHKLKKKNTYNFNVNFMSEPIYMLFYLLWSLKWTTAEGFYNSFFNA